jgi:hypothetical protein
LKREDKVLVTVLLLIALAMPGLAYWLEARARTQCESRGGRYEARTGYCLKKGAGAGTLPTGLAR